MTEAKTTDFAAMADWQWLTEQMVQCPCILATDCEGCEIHGRDHGDWCKCKGKGTVPLFQTLRQECRRCGRGDFEMGVKVGQVWDLLRYEGEWGWMECPNCHGLGTVAKPYSQDEAQTALESRGFEWRGDSERSPRWIIFLPKVVHGEEDDNFVTAARKAVEYRQTRAL